MATWREMTYTGVFLLALLSTHTVNSGKDTLEEVEKKYSDISTAKDRKEEAVALMTPYSDWHHMLAPAPMAIALLGELMLISTKTDFSLEEKPPKDGFKYLKYPSSFRASLVQITNIGWEAFNKAHTSMDQIRLYTTNVDSHMKSMVRILMHGADTEVEMVVPKVLKKMQHIADKCVTLSEDMETRFDYFLNVTAELLEVSTNTKGVYEEKRKENKIAVTVAKTEKEQADKEKEAYDEEYKKISEEIQQAQKDFKDALKSSPSAWKMFGLGLLDTVSSVVRVVAAPFGGPAGRGFNGGYESPYSFEESQEDRSKRHVYKFAEDLTRNIQTLVSVATSGNPKGEKTPNWNEMENIEIVRSSLDMIKQNVERVGIYTDVSQMAMKICREGIRLSEAMIKMKKNIQEPNNASVRTLIIQAEDLLVDSKRFLTQAAMFSQNTFMNQNGPRKPQRHRHSSDSLVQAELNNYEIKVDAATEVLKDARKRQESVHKDIKDNNERIMRTLVKLAELDVKKIDFEKIRETLVEGIKAIAELRKQWNKLTRFFKIMSTIVKAGFHISIKDFIESTETGRDLKMLQGTISDVIRNDIYENAFKASVYAYFVRTISSAYVEVSSKHLMDDITSLGSLIALDPETDKTEIKKQYKNLLDRSTAAQRTIEVLAMERQKQCSEYLDKRIKTIENELKVLFPKTKSEQVDSSEEDKLVG